MAFSTSFFRRGGRASICLRMAAIIMSRMRGTTSMTVAWNLARFRVKSAIPWASTQLAPAQGTARISQVRA